MNGMPVGEYYPVNLPLHRLDARAKLASFLLLLAAVVCTRSILGYMVMCAITAAIIWVSGLPLAMVCSTFRRTWKFLLVIFLMNALFYGTDRVIWRFWIFSFSIIGVLQGLRVVINVALIVSLGNVLLGTTRPAEVTGALTSLLFPLSLIGVPVQDVAMILTVAIRFIPTLLMEADMIRLAQTARGATFDSKRLVDRAKSLLPLMVPLFISAFKRADDLAQAMEARGYRGATGRTAHRGARLQYADGAAMLLCTAVCVLQIILLVVK